MLFISVSLLSMKSGMIGILCWMGTSARHTASFIRWEDWRYLRITPSWRWRKIISLAGNMACVFATCKAATGIRKCWKTSKRIWSGRMILRLSITCASTKQRYCRIRCGDIRSARHRHWMSWCMKKPMICFMSACIKPPRYTMWLFISPARPPVRFYCLTQNWRMPNRCFF